MKKAIGNNCSWFLNTRNGHHRAKLADKNQTRGSRSHNTQVGELWNSWQNLRILLFYIDLKAPTQIHRRQLHKEQLHQKSGFKFKKSSGHKSVQVGRLYQRS